MSFIFQQRPFNYQYQVGIENVAWELAESINQSGVVTNQPLHIVTIPKNAMVQNGQRLLVEGYGSHNGNAGAKTLIARINTVVQLQVSLPATAIGPLGWFSRFYIRRFSASAYECTMSVKHNYPITGSTPNALTLVGISKAIGIDLTLNDLIIEFLATIPNGGDSIGQAHSFASII